MFTKKDYESGYGFNTKIWGPMQWSLLHILSFNYPVNPTKEDKDNYDNYLMALKHTLPCKSCRDNYSNNLIMAEYNIHKLKNRDTFSRFIYDLHNVVNKMLSKPEYATYEVIRDRYEMFRATCVNNTPVIPRKILKEHGCTKPINSVKSQCVINIVPYDDFRDTFVVHRKCIPSIKKSSKKTSRKSSKKSKRSRRS